MEYQSNLTFRQNLLKAVTSDCILDGYGQSFWLMDMDRIFLEDYVNIRNMIINFNSPIEIIPKGKNIKLSNVTINSRGYGSLNPIIELVETDNLTINNLTITGDNVRKCIICKTMASSTSIDGLTIKGNMAWGLLFDDSIREKGRDYRVFDGKDYAGIPIGSGLSIKNFNYGYTKRAGDGIEVNTPDEKFKDVAIENAIIANTIGTDSSGIGLGFAGCDGVCVLKADINSAEKFGFHTEKCTNIELDTFTIRNSNRALSISHTQNGVIRNGKCDTNKELFTSYNSLNEFMPSQNIVIENVSFDGFTKQGMYISNSEDVSLNNVTIKGHNAPIKEPFIKFYEQSKLIIPKSVIKAEINNLHIYDTGLTKPNDLIILEKAKKVKLKSWHSPDFAKRINIDSNIVYS